MATSLDEIKRQFVEQVKLRGHDDQYIDGGEEREILQLALTMGVSVDNAKAALAQVCEAQGYILERVALKQVEDVLAVAAGNDGKIDEKEFNDAVALLKLKTKGKKNETMCKRMVCGLIDDAGFKTTTGWFSSWFANVKREVGLA
jgi:hypothetical protein